MGAMTGSPEPLLSGTLRKMNMESGIVVDTAGSDRLDGDVRRRRSRIILAAIAAAILLIAGYLLFGRGEKAPPPAPALPRVTVVVPGRQTVASMISATGNIAARREMPVGVAGEGGMVARVLVEPGQWVAAGQTLAVIERSVQSQEARALAASIGVARADAALAQSELDRARQLVARGFISKADIDRKTATRDAANARVSVAQAQLGEARARIGRLDIRAPAAGLVLTRAVEPGQVVSSGSGALFRMARGGEMELLARVAEQDLARLTVGIPAQVTPVGTSLTFGGHVWQLSPVIDPQTRQGIARIALDFNKALRPGGFAAARILGGSGQMPLLPQSAVLSDAAGNYVYIVGNGDKVERRPITVGDVNDQGVSVAKGLNGGERVVLSAGAFLNAGDKIVPVVRALPRDGSAS
jgi:HlyD family secretion protein